MPLVAAAVCPHPPMLVPDVASGLAGELDTLREACQEALARLRDSGARSLLVVGSGAAETTRQHPVTASFAGLGVPLEFTLDRATALAPRPLPVSLLVAAWLLREGGWDGDVSMRGLPADLAPRRCAAWRPDDFDTTRPWALLAMGDGSACRTEKAPGYFDERAEAFDDGVAAALANADLDALAALDPDLADELWCAGRPAWQVLAGLLAAEGRDFTGELLYNDFPYGVSYFVASLLPAAPARTGGS